MDIATLIGVLFGSGLVMGAILMGGEATLFVNVPGLLIVMGGSFSALFVKFPMKTVLRTFKVAGKAFLEKAQDQEALIEEIAEVATINRRDGTLALEGYQTDYPFLQQAISYLVANVEPEFIEASLVNDTRILQERHETGKNIFKSLGSYAPAFGMIGTLIGLIQMMASMSDPSQIGPAMAVALLTTFYGALLANLVFLPVADKLEIRSNSEVLSRRLIVDGVVAIIKGQAPSVLKECLQTYLPPKVRMNPYQ
jgi:chemotaxis protein MotA